MKNWKETTKDIGKILENGKKSVSFYGTQDMKEVSGLQSSCGCTTPKFNSDTRELTVTYSAGRVSNHLRLTKKEMVVSQTITVTYTDKTKDILSFTGRVFNF